MDEGIAVGIASHPLAQIPGLLRLDGSPPLYYVLLHLWMAPAGASDVAVHWLSLLLAALCVPAAWWAGACAGGRRTGWILAALVACSPYLTMHATEARMYPLVMLLGLLCVGCFLMAYVRRRRAYRIAFGVTLALGLYTQNWALFEGVALLVALVPVLCSAPREERSGIARDGMVGFGIAALLYAPWLPTLLFQARHTGAPWATAPAASALVDAPRTVLGGEPAAIVVALAVAAALAARGRDARTQAASLGLASVVPLLLAWGFSQRSPAWDVRYLAVILAPLLALAATGMARTGPIGLAALAIVAALSMPAGRAPGRSDAYQLARAAAPMLRRGDLVVATPFAEIPLLARYLPRGLRYASTAGPVHDPRVVDWRDVTQRLGRASVREDLAPVLADAKVGLRVLLVDPVAWDDRSRRTVLGREERRQARDYTGALLHDGRFARIRTLPSALPHLPRASMLRGVVLKKVS
jgi:hypothetical protein